MTPWISRYLTEEQITDISRVVKQVEEKTRGEIVPVIVRASTPSRYVPVVIALVLTLLLALSELALVDRLFVGYNSLLWPVVFALFFGVGLILSRWDWLRRLMIPNGDEMDAVWQRAQLEFYQNKVHKTEDGVGILIFVSILERRAIILGDKAIADKIPQETWQTLVDALLAHIKKGNWHQGFVETVQSCGQILATHFPKTHTDRNELSNHLVIKD